MSGIRVVWCAVVVAVLSVVASGGPAWAQERSPPVDGERIDRYATGYLERARLPGAVVAVTRGGQVVHTAGYGHDSKGRRLTPASPMQVASLSKSMTSLAVMQLVEDGRIALDRPVYRYLPEFRLADRRFRDITVRQLLDQTSGMSDRTFPAASRPQPDTLREAVRRLGDAGLASAPGTEHRYHNPNYHVAARLVEVVGGAPFDSYLRRHVFDPAGMASTGTVTSAGDPFPGLPHGYVQAYGANIALPEPRQFSGGSGGVVSTAHDMARWLVLQNGGGLAIDGTRVVSADSVREMHEPSDPRGRYGLGWMIRDPDEGGHVQVWHGGAHSTYSAYQFLVPGTGYGVFAAFNRGIALTEDDVWGLVAGILAMTEGRTPTLTDSVLWKVDLAFGAATVAVLALTVRGAVRSRRWANARAARARWRSAARLMPYLVPVALLLAFPRIAQFVLGGRDGTWTQRFYGIPAELVFLTVAATCCLVTIGLRCLAAQRGDQQGR